MADLFRAQLVTLLPRLRRFALALTANPAEADDLVQAACERALRNPSLWQPGTRMDSWMFKITQNLWIDQCRARRVQGLAVDVDDPHDDVAVAELSDRDFELRVEQQLSLQQVLEVMRGLPAGMREVLALVSVEGLSYREAADCLGVPLGTVMSRLSRARMELMRRVNPPDGRSA